VVNVGIVGMGKMGILHGSILGALADARVVALAERKGVVRRFARNALPGVKVVEDVSDFAGMELDAVYVATLPSSHHPVVREVYERGIARNVFVEKSLASSHAEALEMCRLAEEHGGVSVVGFQKRFGGMFRKTKELLEEGALGDVASFDAYAYSSDFAEASADAQQAVSRGGVLRDQGSHPIDLAQWFFGDLEVVAPDEADAETRDRPADFTTGKVKAAGGIKGTLSVSAQLADYRLPEIGMTITGSRGAINVNDDRLELTNGAEPRRWHRQDLGDTQVPFLLGDPEYTRESEAFVAAVASGEGAGGADFAAGARVERVIDDILERA
jgi:predicted dehydrogenase